MPAKKVPPKKASSAKAASAAASGMSDLDLVRGLAKILGETGLTEIEFDQAGTHVRVSKGGSTHYSTVTSHAPAPQSYQPAPATAHAPILPAIPVAAEAKPAADHAGVVKSPMVGTAYLSASPGSAPFIEVGQQVKVGQTLIIIEAMKTMNQIPSTVAGRVVQIHVGNADPVEYGEALVTIE